MVALVPIIQTGLGHFFSDEPSVANKFAGAGIYQTMMGEANQVGRVIPMNLRLKNPFVVISQGGERLSTGDRKMHKDYVDAYRVLYNKLADEYNINLGGRFREFVDYVEL